MIQFACSTVACPSKTLSEAVSLADAAGFDAIEFRSFGFGSRAFACDPALTDEAKVRSLLDGAGVGCSSISTGIAFDAPIHPPVIGRAIADQEASVREAKRAIDLAAQIEAPLVRVFGFRAHGRERLSATMKRIVWRLRLVCDHARHTGVRVVVENGGAFETAEPLAELIGLVGSPLLGASYDGAVGHVAGEDPVAAIATLGDRLWLARIKDLRDGRPVALGEGDREAAPFVRALAAAGYGGTLVYDWDAAWFDGLAPAEDVLPAALATLCGWAGQTADAPHAAAV
ncbi:MAG: sugar phosphate isomerase/epimerase family protein [Phycisphaerales bacterium]